MSGKYLSKQSSWPYDLLARLVSLDAGAGHCEGGAEGQEGGGAHFLANMRDRAGARRGRLQDVLCLVPRHS